MVQTSAFSSVRAISLLFLLTATHGASCVAVDARTEQHPSGRADGGSPDRVAAPDGSAAASDKTSDAGGAADGGRDEPADRSTDPAPTPSSVDAGAPAPTADASTPSAPSATDAGAADGGCAAIDKLDLLLMIDNSNSMAAEQASLKNAFPGLIEALTSGARFAGDPKPFPAVRDLHVGVVSSDMGIPGVELPPSCRADGGDDGRLKHAPSDGNCDPSYPAWLSFSATAPGATADAIKFANDMRCIAGLGTGGCGFEQQLESTFKALWPKRYLDATGREVTPNPYRFLATTEQGTWGRGDVPLPENGNLGFLRPATDANPSLIAVVVVTDEDDCSVKSTEHLMPNNQLPEDSPYRAQDINLRCFLNKQHLYDVKARYYEGFRKLRPGMEDRVLFAAIAGVPADLVTPDALAKVDFDAKDSASRQAFYDAVLADTRMRDIVDPLTMPGMGQGNVTTSCSRTVAGETLPSTAFPPRRIVELAKLFDQNSVVQSICQDDFTVPTQAIIAMIARRLEQACGPAR